MEPRTLGRYEILGELGRGGMGVVYRARDPVIDREVAVKTVIVPETISEAARAEFLERFLLEARIAGKLVHPNIVITHDAATDQELGLPFIAMELVRGESLEARLKAKGRLDWREAVSIVIPLAEALAYASTCGVVHRDVKPSNVLLATDGTPKLTDFGIARLPGSNVTRAGTILGSPPFISPEQVRGRAWDGRADLFSLCSVLYCLIVGSPPFTGPDISTIFFRLMNEDPAWPTTMVQGVPEALDRVLAQGLAKDPPDRYETGAELAADLRAVLDGECPTTRLEARENARPAPEATGSETDRLTPAADTADSAGTAGRTDTPSAAEADGAEDPAAARPAGRRSGVRRVVRALAVVCVLVLVALAAYGLAVGPERVLAEVAEAASALDRLGPAGSWVKQRVEALESSVREVRAERRHRAEARRRAETHLAEGRRFRQLGQWQRARASVDESLAAAKQADDGAGESRALLELGRLDAAVGAWASARARLVAAESVARVYEQAGCQATALAAQGALERDLGRFEVAEDLLERAFEMASGLGDEPLLASVQLERAILCLVQARWERADQLLDTSDHDTSDHDTAPTTRPVTDGGASAASETDERSNLSGLWRGVLLFVTGSPERADQVWAEAGQACSESGGDERCAELLLWRGRGRFVPGTSRGGDDDRAAARALLEQAEARLQRLGHLPGQAAAVECLLELELQEEPAETDPLASSEPAEPVEVAEPSEAAAPAGPEDQATPTGSAGPEANDGRLEDLRTRDGELRRRLGLGPPAHGVAGAVVGQGEPPADPRRWRLAWLLGAAPRTAITESRRDVVLRSATQVGLSTPR